MIRDKGKGHIKIGACGAAGSPVGLPMVFWEDRGGPEGPGSPVIGRHMATAWGSSKILPSFKPVKCLIS